MALQQVFNEMRDRWDRKKHLDNKSEKKKKKKRCVSHNVRRNRLYEVISSKLQKQKDANGQKIVRAEETA